MLSSSQYDQSLAEAIPSDQQLLDAACVHEGREKGQCVHIAHCFPQYITKNRIMKETTTKLPYVHV